MKTLAIFLAVTASVAIYVVWLRPWLRTKPSASGFFAWIEPAELLLFRKSESLLWARFLQAVGLAVPLLQYVGAIDITPYAAIIPEGWGPYLMLGIFACGGIGEALRRDTTKPLDQVAIPAVVVPAAVGQHEGEP